jgi:PAS domain S-box-containing protein
VLRHVADVVYALAIDGTILSLNQAFESVTGWPVTEWVGKSFMPLLHPDDLPPVLDLLSQAAAGRPLPRFEARVRTRAGEYLVGEFTAMAQREGGVVRRLFGVVRDVTERKRVDELVAREAERWNAMMAHLPDPIIGKDGRFRSTARRACSAWRTPRRRWGRATPISSILSTPPPPADEQTIGHRLAALSKVERVEDQRGRERWFRRRRWRSAA